MPETRKRVGHGLLFARSQSLPEFSLDDTEVLHDAGVVGAPTIWVAQSV